MMDSNEHSRKVSMSFSRMESKEIRESVQDLTTKLKSEIPNESWKSILSKYGYKFEEKLNFNNVFKFCLKRDIITKDLGSLKSNLTIIQKSDLIEKLDEYRSNFSKISEEEFRKLFGEVAIKNVNPQGWKSLLQKQIISRHSKLETFLGTDLVVLERIYTPLTIIEHEFYSHALEHKGAKNELELLMKDCSSEKARTSGCFEEELAFEEYSLINELKQKKLIDIICCNKWKKSEPDQVQDRSLCIIGNPGSGKTFLSSRIALLYGHNELEHFEYCIAIPCRNPDWHSLEIEIAKESRGAKIAEKDIVSWLELGISQGTRWPKELAEEILNNEGRDLLLILDSIDEFTKKVPFKQTLLYSLLTKTCLSKSTLLLTSRPGAWYDITSENSDIKVGAQFHVLGFSQENRDIFFANSLNDESKFNECKRLFRHHHEIGLLSLVPVNASYFAHLFKSTFSLTSYTLTHLFKSLVLYLIRRQLSRMGLANFIQVEKISELADDILKCLHEIGELAYEGISHRELSFSHNSVLKIKDEKKRESEWLGLANMHIKEISGVKMKVWSFSHLTMQEFVSALWLHTTRWFTICLVTRYVVSSIEEFSKFKMVLRFVCGLLGDEAVLPIAIVFKHQLIPPIEFRYLPLFQQLCYEDKPTENEGVFNNNIDRVFENSDMTEYTRQFLSLISFVIETESESLIESNQPPAESSFYICDKVDPSEWLNFTKSLKYLTSIHLIFFISDYITAEELDLFAENLTECNLNILAIRFIKKKYEDMYPYFEVLSKYDLESTKICFDLIECKLTDTYPSSDLFNIGENNYIYSFRCVQNEIAETNLKNLSSQLTKLKNIFFLPQYCCDNSKLFTLLKNTSIQGLHLIRFPHSLFNDLVSALSTFKCLEEFSIKDTHEAYSLLPHLQLLTKITYLNMSSDHISNQDHSDYLIQLLDQHKDFLKILQLSKFSITESNVSANTFFTSLQSCTALVMLKLENWQMKSDFSSLSKLRMPESLISLEIFDVPLKDSGLECLIRMIVFHKALRYVKIIQCGLSSKSCLNLCNLLFTLIQLRKLDVSKRELSEPDKEEFAKIEKALGLLSSKLIRSHSVTAPVGEKDSPVGGKPPT